LSSINPELCALLLLESSSWTLLPAHQTADAADR